jgi:3-hydroxy-3-methylglutaryl CoA synthase
MLEAFSAVEKFSYRRTRVGANKQLLQRNVFHNPGPAMDATPAPVRTEQQKESSKAISQSVYTLRAYAGSITFSITSASTLPP